MAIKKNIRGRIAAGIKLIIILQLSILLFATAMKSTSAASTFVDSPILNISLLNQQPDPVSPGNYVDLRFRVENTGAKTADQYTYKLDAKYPFYFDGSDSATKNIASLDGYSVANEGAVLYWKVRIDQHAVIGDNSIRLLYWKTGDNSTIYQTQPFTIRVQSSEGLLQIGNVQVTPSSVELGRNFNITIPLQNLGYNPVNNVRVTAGSGSAYFIPADSSNEKIVGTVYGNQESDVKYTFFVSSSTPLAVQALPVVITYTDNTGSSHTLSTSIGVPVDSKASYFANLEDTKIYMTGQKGSITASVSNIGQPEMYHVTLQLLPSSDYDVIGSTTSYLGNLQSDDFETGQFMVYSKNAQNGNLPLNFEMKYADSYGRQHTENFTLNNTIYNKTEAARLGLVASGGKSWVVLLVIVIIIGGIWYFNRRRKSKMKSLKG